MSGFLWLISEMLLLLTLAAAVFFTLGWRWQARRARARIASLEKRLDEETAAARLARQDLEKLPSPDPHPPAAAAELAALAAELSESQARQLFLERELLRLRDAHLDAEKQLQSLRNSAPPPPPPPPDDLTRIRGVGSVMRSKLHTAGITTFQQLASLDPQALASLDRQLKLQGRATRERWQEQARSLHAEARGCPP